MSMGNMAIARPNVKAIILLGIALLSCVADGASRGHLFKTGARRSVASVDRKIFDITAFGAKTEGGGGGGANKGNSKIGSLKVSLPELPGGGVVGDTSGSESTDEADEAGPDESPTEGNGAAIIKTWVAACRGNYTGPTTVLIPKGTFLTGPVIFQGPCTSSKEPIVVQVDGTLKASTDLSEYSSPEWFLFEMVDGMIVTGQGVFDGQGQVTWKAKGEKGDEDGPATPPSSLKFHRVNNTVVEGIKSVNSKFFHAHVYGCTNITFNNVHLIAPGDSPNTDGVHTSTSSKIHVMNSIIATGDDCVSIGQGSTEITVNNVTCGPGHGISIGSLGKYEDELGVSQVHVTNCTFKNTTNGARIKTWGGKNVGEATGIFYEDLIMEDVQNPIVIDQNYGNKKGGKKQPGAEPSGTPSNWKISDVHFKNIRGSSSRNVAVSLACSRAKPCEGVELADIDFKYNGAKQGMSVTSECFNAKIVPKGVQNPPLCR